jgi:hypothetical protein
MGYSSLAAAPHTLAMHPQGAAHTLALHPQGGATCHRSPPPSHCCMALIISKAFKVTLWFKHISLAVSYGKKDWVYFSELRQLMNIIFVPISKYKDSLQYSLSVKKCLLYSMLVLDIIYPHLIQYIS